MKFPVFTEAGPRHQANLQGVSASNHRPANSAGTLVGLRAVIIARMSDAIIFCASSVVSSPPYWENRCEAGTTQFLLSVGTDVF